MAGVDNRIVTMQFNNREFERNARTSMSTLQKLKESINFGAVVGGTVKGLGVIESALTKIGLKTPFAPLIRGANIGLSGVGMVLDKLGMKNPFVRSVEGASELQSAAAHAGGPQGMGALEGGVTAVSNRFILLTTMAVTALTNITNRAVNAGIAFGKSFTFAPINEGLAEYELNLKSIQTIQANTDKPLKRVEDSLDILNKYADQTIYNFAEMARNIGTFTAAGVDLETSVSAIKGIANMAALSGSTSQQAATAMYQLSQALAAGKVSLMDWNSVVNAGMGGKKLQNALAQTAIAMGELDEAQVRGAKSGERLTIMGTSFRESIMAGPGQTEWLTSKVLENSLAALDGRYSVAALRQEKFADGTLKYKTKAEAVLAVEKARNQAAKEGIVYSDAQFKELQKLSTSAFIAATKVKTLGQVFEIAKETIASGWSASFRSIFGNVAEAKKLFTGMSVGLNGILEANALARNNLLAAWKDRGGRDLIIDGLKNAWTGFYEVIKAVSAGFRDIFPKQTPKTLMEMSRSFADFTKNLIPSEETLAKIRDISSGVFSVFKIGKIILLGVIEGIKTLLSNVGAGEGHFLGFAAGVGDMVTRFANFLEQTGIVTAFFEGLGHILSVPLSILKGFGSVISAIFGGFDSAAADQFGDAVDGAGERLSGLAVIGDKIRAVFEKVGDFFGNLGTHIAEALFGIGEVVAGAFTADTFGATLDAINTTLLAGIVLLIRRFFTQGVEIDLTGGLFSNINKTLGEATGAFQNMQQSLKADILLKIAVAIGVMAAALLVLSLIDPKALTKALGAMSAGFAILIGVMIAITKLMGYVGFVQLYVITAAMTKLSVSILLLALALRVLSSLSFGEMLRGLFGLGVMMFILSKAMAPLMANTKGMARMSFSLILIGVALNIMAVALKIFASMSWEEMIRGLAGLAGTLVILAIALRYMPDLKAEALGLIALGISMNLLAVALKIFATMSWEEMAKGLIMMAGSLAIIAYAIKSMPKSMIAQAAGLLVVSSAMVILASAIKIMGSMGWEEVGKGLLVLGGALAILALALKFMGGTGAMGAAGLMVAAMALTVLAPVMLAFGAMKWSSIAKGLAMLAGVFIILGLAGFYLAPLTPVIMGLSLAIFLIGAAVLLAGTGIALFVAAFTALIGVGTAGALVMGQMMLAIAQSIPIFLVELAKGLGLFSIEIAKQAPRFAVAAQAVIGALLDGLIKNVPKMGKLFMVMIETSLKVLYGLFPAIYKAGIEMIVGFMEAVEANIGRIIDLATSIITQFIDGIARNLPKIIDSAMKFMITFMDGLARAIRENSEEMGEKGADLGIAIIEGVLRGMNGIGGRINELLLGLARDAWKSVKDFFGVKSPSRLMRDTVGKPIVEGWAVGIKESAPMVVDELGTVGKSAMGKLSTVMSELEQGFAIDPNFNPTITPVLDLAELTKEANKMSSILATAPIVPTMSYQTAADISNLTQAAAEAESAEAEDILTASVPQNVTYEQHLHSPKPLDSVEVYRGTKSLLSLKKEELFA